MKVIEYSVFINGQLHGRYKSYGEATSVANNLRIRYSNARIGVEDTSYYD